MKKTTSILFSILMFIGCSDPATNNPEGKDTFTLVSIDIALIYEDKIDGIPCLLHSITDTLKANKDCGIILKFDVSYDNPRPSDGCCAFEPGVEGTEKKIKDINVYFSSDTSKINVTRFLFNEQESQLKNRFKDFIQGQFSRDDYICTCKNGSNFIEYINRKHLYKSYSQKYNKLGEGVNSSIDSLIEWYNVNGVDKHYLPGWKLTGDYFYFWLPKETLNDLHQTKTISVICIMEDGTKLTYKRNIINELQQGVKTH